MCYYDSKKRNITQKLVQNCFKHTNSLQIKIYGLIIIKINSNIRMRENQKKRTQKKQQPQLCSICMSRKVSASVDGCSHHFCNTCIKDWVKRDAETCPLCRVDVKVIASIRTGRVLYRVRKDIIRPSLRVSNWSQSVELNSLNSLLQGQSQDQSQYEPTLVQMRRRNQQILNRSRLIQNQRRQQENQRRRQENQIRQRAQQQAINFQQLQPNNKKSQGECCMMIICCCCIMGMISNIFK